jgi:hypothetical protein
MTNDGQHFIEVAESHLGYTARPGMQSYFGAKVGYDGLPWAGAFIDVVAREAGVDLPACVYPPSGLAEFIHHLAWRPDPKPGDIAFFTFPTDGQFGMPHVGIVTGIDDWRRTGRFETIEAQVESGLPKGSKLNDGVYRRVRWSSDVLGFGRPVFRQRPAKGVNKTPAGSKTIRLTHVNGKKPNRAMEAVQLALAVKAGLRNYRAGVLDSQTRAAYARWQRAIGYAGSDVTGIPDLPSLIRLGRETGLFTGEE